MVRAAADPLPSGMTITVNGETRDVPEGTTVAALVVRLGLEKAAVAAEVNGTLVPKRRHADTTLTLGDKVELVSLVGGG